MRRDVPLTRTAGLWLARVVVPVAIVVAGAIVIGVGGSAAADGLGVGLIGVGLLVALVNALVRLGIQSEGDREREERAREHFDLHGSWPRRGRPGAG